MYELFLDHEERGGKVILEHDDGTKEALRILS
jgi:hypothetical protein